MLRLSKRNSDKQSGAFTKCWKCGCLSVTTLSQVGIMHMHLKKSAAYSHMAKKSRDLFEMAGGSWPTKGRHHFQLYIDSFAGEKEVKFVSNFSLVTDSCGHAHTHCHGLCQAIW